MKEGDKGERHSNLLPLKLLQSNPLVHLEEIKGTPEEVFGPDDSIGIWGIAGFQTLSML